MHKKVLRTHRRAVPTVEIKGKLPLKKATVAAEGEVVKHFLTTFAMHVKNRLKFLFSEPEQNRFTAGIASNKRAQEVFSLKFSV